MPTFRKYRHSDWESYLALDLETGLASMGAASPAARERFIAQWPESLRTRYAWTDLGPTAQGSQLWVLDDDEGQYAGHLWTTEQLDFFSGERKLFITTVALRAACRGRGWGRLLMEKAFELAREGGYAAIGLGVEAGNAAAIGLYEEFGFKTRRLSMEARVERF